MRKLFTRDFLMTHWRPLALYGGLFAFLAILLAVRLDTLLGGYSLAAVQDYQAGINLHHILDNPVNAPLSLAAYCVAKLHTAHSLLLLRGATAGVGLLTLALFCGLLRYWHDARTALFGTLLLGTSSWFLLTARSGTAVILQFGLFALIACGVWLRATGNPFAVLIGLGLAATLAYVPGMVILIILGILWQWKAIDRAFKKHLGVVTLAGCMFIALLAPLALSLYHHPMLFKQFLNLPATGWPMPLTILHNLIDVPLHIFVRGNVDAATIMGQLPMLDFFSTAMFLLGSYLYLQHFGLHRSRFFLTIFIGASFVIALGGATDIRLLLPFLYLVIAVGVSYMLEQWFKIFPRNPIAQGIGLFAVGVVIALACAYHMRLYFVAWPQSSETQATFAEHEPPVLK
jgi:hypothetical protein